MLSLKTTPAKWLPVAGAFAVALWLGACAQSRSSADSQRAGSTPIAAVVMDEELHGRVSIVRQELEQNESGIVIAKAHFINPSSDEPLEIVAQTLFLDEEGRQVDASPMRLLLVEPESMEIYHTGSSESGIVRCAIHFRQPGPYLFEAQPGLSETE